MKINTHTSKKKLEKKCTLDKQLMQNQTNRKTKEKKKEKQRNTYTQTHTHKHIHTNKIKTVQGKQSTGGWFSEQRKAKIPTIKIKLTKIEDRKQDQSSKPNQK